MARIGIRARQREGVSAERLFREFRVTGAVKLSLPLTNAISLRSAVEITNEALHGVCVVAVAGWWAFAEPPARPARHLFHVVGDQKARMLMSAVARSPSATITGVPSVVTPNSSLANSSGRRMQPWLAG